MNEQTWLVFSERQSTMPFDHLAWNFVGIVEADSALDACRELSSGAARAAAVPAQIFTADELIEQHVG
jgi:hypothetical protein